MTRTSDRQRTTTLHAALTAKPRERLSYPYVVSTLALIVAIFAAVWTVAHDGDSEGQPATDSIEQAVGSDQAFGRAFVADNPDVAFVNEDGITQVSGPSIGQADRGEYLVSGAVRVNDSDATTGEGTVIECRLVRNPGSTFVDGRSVRLIDTGVKAAPLQENIALNGLTDLSDGQQIDMVCAQEAESGNVEATVDSARLTYARVAP